MALIALPFCAEADPLSLNTIQRASLAMQKEVSEEAEKYADRIGIDNDYFIYCATEFNLKTDQLPTHGSIPYGIAYLEIKDKEIAELVLQTARAHRRAYLLLCLANAKNTLTAAEKH